VTLNFVENMMRVCDICMFMCFPSMGIYYGAKSVQYLLLNASLCMPKIVLNNTARYATDLYHNVSLFIECLEGHS
jgi:hypothetical protein